MDLETTRLLKRGLPLYSALAITLLVLALAAILHLGRDVFVPIALAVLLSFVLAPGVRLLQRLLLPQGAAVLATVLLAFGLLALLAVLMGGQLAALGAELPRYMVTIREKIGALGGGVSGGTISRAMEAMNELARDLQGLAGGAGPAVQAGETRPIPVVVREGGGLIGTLGGFVSPLLHPLATAGLVLVFVIFILAAREDLRNRVVRLVGTDDIQHTTEVIDDAGRRLSKLFLTQLALNAAFGTVIGLGLWAIGIPSPFLWGAFAGVTRFVPYIGTAASIVPPLALAVAVDPGWTMLLWTVILFAVVDPLVGHGLEPMLLGHSTGISPVAVLLSATVWTFLWGPIGLVLAIPLTVCIVVVGRHVEELGFLDVMLGDRPALSPPEIFYQRMLAGDPAEAHFAARDFLRERALVTYYDEVALAALRLAHEDVARGRLTPERQEVVRRSTDALIALLDAVADPRPRGGQVGAEAAAAVLAAGPDRDAATRVLARAELRAEWRGEAPVLVYARPDTLDETIGKMLTQVLTKHGVAARLVGSATEGDDATRSAAGRVRLVCLSYLEPLSTLHLRHAVRIARRRCENADVLLGIWRERDPAIGRVLGRAARADVMAPTIGAALSAAIQRAAIPPATGSRP